jgi:hypothetical protein
VQQWEDDHQLRESTRGGRYVTSEDLDVYMQALLHREFTGERTKIEVGPYSAMLLVAALKWIARQGQFATHGPAMFDEVLKQLQTMFLDDPAGMALIQLYSPPSPEQR